MIILDKGQIKRFWKKVDKSGTCWIWLGASAGGRTRRYGIFRLKNPRRLEYAHRIAWVLKNKKQIPKGFYVLHKPPCTNQLCIRHLHTGTQKDNMADHRKMGGSFIHTSKLSTADVRQIRQLVKNITQHELAKKFDVSRALISRIIHRKIWIDV